ncbi:disease resistance protein PIK5-NP-like [Oryza brachyantha]|uniref:Uncharacterized protein n=1 Tax=Oryza brachyantha TaxID=4533 RepID=J3N9J2_ORYBR|nr:disease resistance protein PIK5-NP-like [Oryza brachyantha]
MEQEQLLASLEYLRNNISRKLADAADGGWQLTDARERHCFAFMEMELGAVVTSLRTPSHPHGGVDQDWLQELRRLVRQIERLVLVKHGEAADPPTCQCHALLRKAKRRRSFFRRRTDSYSQIQHEAYGLHLAAERPRGWCERPNTSSDPPPHAAAAAAAGGDRPVGINAAAKRLLRRLMAADTSLRFMAIAGPAGMGKTTLAVELHRRLRRQTKLFECCAVASFSRMREPVRTKLFLHTVVSQIAGLEASSSHNSETNDQLAASIWKHLQYKRYFILIDDISKDSDWGIINDAFPANYCGSRILLTTRSELIASCCVSHYDGDVHMMKPLSDSNSDRLLRTKAFGSMDSYPPDNLKLLYKEILNKCRGIPLFITGMAEWLKHHEQQQREISAVPTEEQVRMLFKQFEQKLSFKYSYKLRPSLYLSMFPQGYVFDKNHFAMKWLLEGLAGISSGLKLDMEQAKMSFTEMVDTNIISPVAENCGLNLDEDELQQWQVNPFIREFLASKAAEKGYVFTSTTLSSAPAPHGDSMNRIARRLALHNDDPWLSALLQQLNPSHTRSLLICGAVDRTAVPLDKFAYLVVLDLQGWANLKDEDLVQICKMFLLTYLSVSRTRVSKLPPQVKELRILNTLDVSHTHIAELPSEVCKLTSLRMLDLRGTKISQVPEQIAMLHFLKTLLVGGDGVVTKIPHMTDLQLSTLATVDLSEYPASFVNALGRQSSLRVLAITWSFHQSTDEAYRKALRSSIEQCKELRSLTIHCAQGCSMEFLGSLSDPPKELEKFKVTTGRFVGVPQWIGGLEHHLAFLQITVCKLEPDGVTILGSLRCLKCLVLGLEFVPEEEIVIGSETFRELERFSLDCPVPWLTFSQGAMPMLNYLQLKICSGPANQAGAAPSGLTKLPRIREVVICYSKWCSDSSSVKMTVRAVRKQLGRHPGQIDLVVNSKEVVTRRHNKRQSGTKNVVHQLMWPRGQ